VVTSERPSEADVAPLLDAGIEVLRCGLDFVDLADAVAELAARDLSGLLCEGGPRLHRDLLAAGLVDSLSLTLAPLVVGGDGARTTSGAPLSHPPSFALAFALLADDGTLFTSYARA